MSSDSDSRGRKKKDVREIETEALTLIDQTLVAAENFLSFDVEDDAKEPYGLRKIMKTLDKARTAVANMRQRYIEREYPIAAAQRSYRCPKCRADVSPICVSCGNDPRIK